MRRALPLLATSFFSLALGCSQGAGGEPQSPRPAQSAQPEAGPLFDASRPDGAVLKLLFEMEGPARPLEALSGAQRRTLKASFGKLPVTVQQAVLAGKTNAVLQLPLTYLLMTSETGGDNEQKALLALAVGGRASQEVMRSFPDKSKWQALAPTLVELSQQSARRLLKLLAKSAAKGAPLGPNASKAIARAAQVLDHLPLSRAVNRYQLQKWPSPVLAMIGAGLALEAGKPEEGIALLKAQGLNPGSQSGPIGRFGRGVENWKKYQALGGVNAKGANAPKALELAAKLGRRKDMGELLAGPLKGESRDLRVVVSQTAQALDLGLVHQLNRAGESRAFIEHIVANQIAHKGLEQRLDAALNSKQGVTEWSLEGLLGYRHVQPLRESLSHIGARERLPIIERSAKAMAELIQNHPQVAGARAQAVAYQVELLRVSYPISLMADSEAKAPKQEVKQLKAKLAALEARFPNSDLVTQAALSTSLVLSRSEAVAPRLVALHSKDSQLSQTLAQAKVVALRRERDRRGLKPALAELASPPADMLATTRYRNQLLGAEVEAAMDPNPANLRQLAALTTPAPPGGSSMLTQLRRSVDNLSATLRLRKAAPSARILPKADKIASTPSSSELEAEVKIGLVAVAEAAAAASTDPADRAQAYAHLRKQLEEPWPQKAPELQLYRLFHLAKLMQDGDLRQCFGPDCATAKAKRAAKKARKKKLNAAFERVLKRTSWASVRGAIEGNVSAGAGVYMGVMYNFSRGARIDIQLNPVLLLLPVPPEPPKRWQKRLEKHSKLPWKKKLRPMTGLSPWRGPWLQGQRCAWMAFRIQRPD